MSSGNFGPVNMNDGIPTPAPAPAPRSNGLGIAGFVISLFGLLCTLGLLAPIGLLLSALGLRRQPRGLAAAGVVIGGLGTLFVLLIVVWGRPYIGTAATMFYCSVDLQTYATSHHGTLPSDWKSVVTAAGHKTADSWGREMRFDQTANAFELRSAGPDGEFNTPDDIPFPVRIAVVGVPATSSAPFFRD